MIFLNQQKKKKNCFANPGLECYRKSKNKTWRVPQIQQFWGNLRSQDHFTDGILLNEILTVDNKLIDAVYLYRQKHAEFLSWIWERNWRIEEQINEYVIIFKIRRKKKCERRLEQYVVDFNSRKMFLKKFLVYWINAIISLTNFPQDWLFNKVFFFFFSM